MRRKYLVWAAVLLAGLALAFPRPYPGKQAEAGELPPLAALPAQARPAPDAPLDLNAADAAQLEALPGIGPARAKAILDYRAQNGPFRQVEELAAVKGIGPALLDRLRPYVTVE